MRKPWFVNLVCPWQVWAVSGLGCIGRIRVVGVRSQKLVMECSEVVGRECIKAETVGVPSNPRKVPVKSFTRQGGSLGSG